VTAITNRPQTIELPTEMPRLDGKHGVIRPVLNAIFMYTLPIVGGLGALVTLAMGRVTPTHLVLFFVGFLLTGLGITVGFHRMLTHRSFETNPAVRALLLILGSMAVEGPAKEWVSLHLQHHAHSDAEDDPHSPNDGFFHAHWGWMMHVKNQRNGKYTAAVERDPVAMFVSRTFILWVAVGYIVPFLIAGWEGFIWGGLFRQLAVHQVTFAVNSAAHRWGSRPFDTRDESRNNWWVGILALGEGWHNNHHAFPSSAFHGLWWWQFDLSSYVIRVLQATGLAWHVQHPTPGQIQRRLRASAN
jgi:stearoyl-CoA desaturase (Delta-9 desaturase)